MTYEQEVAQRYVLVLVATVFTRFAGYWMDTMPRPTWRECLLWATVYIVLWVLYDYRKAKKARRNEEVPR